MTTASPPLNREAKIARALERAALLALCAFVAWGPLAQGSTFAGGRAGLTVLGLLTGGLYLASAVLSGERRPWRSLWVLTLLALLAWTTLSVWQASSRAVALPQGLLLGSVFLAALAARGLLVPAGRRGLFGGWLLLVAVTMAAYVAVQHVAGGFTLQVDPDTLSGFYYHPSHYVGFVTLALPVCVWALFEARGWPPRVAGLVAGLILLGSLLYTNSSSLPTALLAAAAATVLAVWRRHRRLGQGAAALLLLGVLAGGWLLATAPGRQTLDGLMGGIQTKSVDAFLTERGKLWAMDARAAQAAPLTGVGPGHFVAFITRFRPERAEGGSDLAFNFVNYAHNDYYQLAIELGWPGLGLYALLLVLTLAAAPRQDPLGASLLAGLGAVWLSGIWDAHATVVPGTMAWTWVACGLVAARSVRMEQPHAVTEPALRPVLTGPAPDVLPPPQAHAFRASADSSRALPGGPPHA
ncbi:O-antigen ligase family protein [Deinococcus enclensis]|uniref:O-antigen ligase n=1 Tax=Deinococcus enclensis TaxID=1049582 RepID=A0ABT9MBY1_9DEIO|nr:O-antigen ligase family protein [Deinococcus enclensis]MDP9764082.1 O-antigen ligase [Deinococcus enclensis]